MRLKFNPLCFTQRYQFLLFYALLPSAMLHNALLWLELQVLVFFQITANKNAVKLKNVCLIVLWVQIQNSTNKK